jgi:Fe2+ transport system protein FeoA
MTLAEVEMQRPVRVVRFERLSPADELRLAGLGLKRGSPVTKVMRTPLRDPVECLVGPQLLALDAWLLSRIVVEDLNGGAR